MHSYPTLCKKLFKVSQTDIATTNRTKIKQTGAPQFRMGVWETVSLCLLNFYKFYNFNVKVKDFCSNFVERKNLHSSVYLWV